MKLTHSAAALLGRKGGKAGTGKSKRRSKAHYQLMARASARARQSKEKQNG